MIAEFGAAKITFPVTIDYRAQSLSRSIVVYTQINEFCNVLQVTVSHMKGRLMHPRIVQGGMGIGVSGWHLARKVSLAGELGTVSGAGIWLVMARRLQDGDQGGHYRRALAEFPDQAMAQSILKRYFLPDGRQGKKYREVPIMRLRLKNGSQQGPLSEHLENLMVTAGFAEVWLAKEGQPGVVAINLLEKIQLSLLPILYGAMIASVDYVLIGAGLPAQIPEALDLLAQHRPARYLITVEGSQSHDQFAAAFDPKRFLIAAPLHRPFFFPIISISLVATILDRRKGGRIDGWIIEGPTAGGHNAPPRSKKLGPDGEPEYGPKDEADLAQISALGLPFYLAGSYGGPEQLAKALELGAVGIQVGSIFALSRDAGILPEIRNAVLDQWRGGGVTVRTNPRSSPSGYPFKEVDLAGTVTDDNVVRQLICDIGALRTPYRQDNGLLGYRCPAEPLDDFLTKGGKIEKTGGARCVCNGLFATTGCGQVRPDGSCEPALVTLGTDVRFLHDLDRDYGAEDALDYLRTPVSDPS